jgi:hypothetical protein
MPSTSEDVNVARHKRRRKALSCLECRRRKVKCDRKYPCCNRCQESGDIVTCTYTNEGRRAQDDDGSQSGDEEVEELVHMTSKAVYLNTPASTVTPSAHVQSYDLPESVSSTLRIQARKIAHLEQRLAVLEATPAQVLTDIAQSRVLSEFNIVHPKSLDHDAGRSEVMLFGGKGFKTRYHGTSSPFSTLVHVRFCEFV